MHKARGIWEITRDRSADISTSADSRCFLARDLWPRARSHHVRGLFGEFSRICRRDGFIAISLDVSCDDAARHSGAFRIPHAAHRASAQRADQSSDMSTPRWRDLRIEHMSEYAIAEIGAHFLARQIPRMADAAADAAPTVNHFYDLLDCRERRMITSTDRPAPMFLPECHCLMTSGMKSPALYRYALPPSTVTSRVPDKTIHSAGMDADASASWRPGRFRTGSLRVGDAAALRSAARRR